MQLVFATNNPDKIAEIKPLLPLGIELCTLQSLDCREDIPETGTTLEENATLKASYVHQRYGLPSFADDTGLLVDSLRGAPGVYSARYAGAQKNADDNIDKLLRKLGNNRERTARFETVIALVNHRGVQIFKGTAKGHIATQRAGRGGFGYDPIFIPDGYQQSFAELPMAEKNRISHRAKAFQKLLAYLDRLAKPE